MRPQAKSPDYGLPCCDCLRPLMARSGSATSSRLRPLSNEHRTHSEGIVYRRCLAALLARSRSRLIRIASRSGALASNSARRIAFGNKSARVTPAGSTPRRVSYVPGCASWAMSQDCEGAWPHHRGAIPANGRRGDRTTVLFAALHESACRTKCECRLVPSFDWF
jgi:hypothetical protein